MSKLVIKNNINSELSITHADNKPAKSIIASDIAVAVDTINDFPLDASDGDTVIVRDLNRGGTFIYDSSKVAEHNDGTNFNGWIRQYSSAVNVKWFGASKDRVDNEIPINLAHQLFGKVEISEDYKISSPIILTMDTQNNTAGIISNRYSTISPDASFVGSALINVETSHVPDEIISSIEGLILDGLGTNIIGIDFYRNGTPIGFDVTTLDLSNSEYPKNMKITNTKVLNCFIGARVTGDYHSFTSCYIYGNELGIHSTQASNSISFIDTSIRRNTTACRIETIDNSKGTVDNNFVNCIIESNTWSGIEVGGVLTNLTNVYFENNGNGTATSGGYIDDSYSNEQCLMHNSVGAGGYSPPVNINGCYFQNNKKIIAESIKKWDVSGCSGFQDLELITYANGAYGPLVEQANINNLTVTSTGFGTADPVRYSFLYNGDIFTQSSYSPYIVKDNIIDRDRNNTDELDFKDCVLIGETGWLNHPGDNNPLDIMTLAIPSDIQSSFISINIMLYGINSGGNHSHAAIISAEIATINNLDNTAYAVINKISYPKNFTESSSVTPPDAGKLLSSTSEVTMSTSGVITITDFTNVSVDNLGYCDRINFMYTIKVSSQTDTLNSVTITVS